METIRLQFESNLKEKIMTFLETLPSKEVEITLEDPHFEHNRKIIHKQYEEFKQGKVKTYSIEEVEKMVFNDEEVDLIVTNSNFETTKKRVHESYERLKSGSEKLYDIDEADAMLGKLISEYENKV